MADTFKNVPQQDNPASRHFAVVTGDTSASDFAIQPRGIYCASAGTAQCVDAGGVVLPYTMAAGDWLPIRPIRINTTSTTGTFYGWY